MEHPGGARRAVWLIAIGVTVAAVLLTLLDNRAAQRFGMLAVGGIGLTGAILGRGRLGPRARLAGRLVPPIGTLGFGIVLLALGLTAANPRETAEVRGVGTAILLVGVGAAVIGIGALLNERLRDYAADVVLESTVIAAVLTVTFWLLVVENHLEGAALTAPQLVGAISVVALAVVAALTSARLGLGRRGTATARLLCAGSALIAVGRTLGMLRDVHEVGTVPAITALSVAGVGLLAAGVAHPGIAELQTSETMDPVRMGIGRLAILVVAVLVVPVITGLRLLHHEPVEVRSVIVAGTLLSLAVVAYLVGLLREWSRIEHRTQHDELTGLPNRRNFHERLAIEVREAEDAERGMAVMFLDLDRFKVVNDSLGHAVGNLLLEAVADRIAAAVPESAVAARLQGDEFAILLPGVSDDSGEALEVADAVLSSIARPCTLQRRKLYITASVGIAHYPADGADWESLLRSADTAMYQAKEQGRNNAKVHTPEMHMTAVGRLDLETALHDAIERGELSVLYQPKVELETGKVVGCEALVRWTHPDLGPISPDEFINIAEETGLIVPLGEWVLQEACGQAKRWQDAGFPHLRMAVNLSARQFQLTNVADVVASILRTTKVDPRMLELELTESLAVQNVARVSTTLHELVEMGVSCSIDDFGTGYSGLRYLASFPLATVKVDKAFVWGIGGDGTATSLSAIVVAVIAMAKGLGMRVCAEGVETQEQMHFLRRHGCDEIQGLLFSPPVEAETFESLLMLEHIAPGAGRLGDRVIILPT